MLKGKLIRNLAERLERRTLRAFDRVSSISDAMVKRAIAKGVAPKRAIYLANWVDTTAIQPQAQERRTKNPYRKELGIDENSLILLYSGSMNKKQGLDILVDVIKKLNHIEGLAWLIAGEGPTKNQLERETDGMKNVKILPLQPLERMEDWLNLADIHLLPQKAGAADLVLPSKLMGILASGRPVVASSPKASELGKIASQAGLRAEPDDSEDFANAARELIENKPLRLSLGNTARKIAEKHYEKERILNSLEAMLKELEFDKKLKRANS
jgi:colanic acid biosynthesis glycosyl transferase WcaI